MIARLISTLAGLAAAGALAGPAAACSPVVYVDADATGAGDGSSWIDAVGDVQSALAVAGQCSLAIEVWVAEGIYTPTAGADRAATFLLQNGVGIYGGFAGTETQRDQRDPQANETVLSGDIGVPADSTDNVHHVVSALAGVDSTAILDGFTITGGQADGSNPDDDGAGITTSSAAPTLSRLVIRNNVAAGSGGGLFVGGTALPALRDIRFEANRAGLGGGIFKPGGPMVLDRVTLIGNHAASVGGGMYAGGGTTVHNSVFDGNTSANNGGAMYLLSSSATTLADVVFSGNSATNGGGALYVVLGSPDLVNTLFIDNAAGTGGAIFNRGTPTLVNSILLGNSAAVDPEISNLTGTVTVTHSLIVGSGGSGAGWDPALGTDGGGNLDVDPQFADPGAGDYHPAIESPVIDAGVLVPGVTALDLDGNPRVLGSSVDIGVYETDLGLVIGSIEDVGNDQGRRVRIRFTASAFDRAGSSTPVLRYEAFRRIDPPPAAPGSQWEFVAGIPAHAEPSYGILAETLADSSVAAGIRWSAFTIRAATADPLVSFTSNPDSGYSVDNLVPSIPTGLAVSGTILTWAPNPAPDLESYAVYASDSGRLDGTERIVTVTTGESADIGPAPEAFVLVTAIDRSGNESAPARLRLDGRGGSGAPVVPALTSVWPNPSPGASSISFDLPRDGRVRLQVFDARGRLVRTLQDGSLPAGRHTRTWSGRTEAGVRAPAGIYFYRYEAGDYRAARKIVRADPGA